MTYYYYYYYDVFISIASGRFISPCHPKYLLPLGTMVIKTLNIHYFGLSICSSYVFSLTMQIYLI